MFTAAWCSVGFLFRGSKLNLTTIAAASTTAANIMTGKKHVLIVLLKYSVDLCRCLVMQVLPHRVPELIYTCTEDYGALDFKVTFILEQRYYGC